jgi:hypothetical protein
MILQSDAETLELQLSSKLDWLGVRLQQKLQGRGRELQLVLQEDGIVLRGFARTYHAKQLAQHALMMETEMPILANEIEVC